MKQLLFINPNSTGSMTEKIRLAAEAVAPPDITIHARTSTAGPASIQGPEDGAAALPGLLNEIDAGVRDGMDALVIACFDDTGLAEARARAGSVPVIGLCEAACHACALPGLPFSIVTTLAVSVPIIEANVRAYAMQDYCRRVRASGVAVLELEVAGSDAELRISEEISRALTDDGCRAIVLGCAGMADLASRLSERHGVSVVDGVVAATGLAAVLLSVRG